MALLNTKDPAIIELESIVRNRLRVSCNFIVADLTEANFGVDALDGAPGSPDFPVFVYLKQGKNTYEVGEAHVYDRNLKLYGFLLNHIDEATMKGLSSAELGATVYLMRQLCENLVYQINQSSLSVAGGVDKFEIDDIFEKFDANLYGCAISLDWDVQGGASNLTGSYQQNGY